MDALLRGKPLHTICSLEPCCCSVGVRRSTLTLFEAVRKLTKRLFCLVACLSSQWIGTELFVVVNFGRVVAVGATLFMKCCGTEVKHLSYIDSR